MPTLTDYIRAEAWPMLLQGWRWWVGELAGLWPDKISWSLSRRPRADVRLGRDGVEIVRVSGDAGERLVESTSLAAFGEENWREMAALLAGHRARLLLMPPLSHIVALTLPRAARPYLRTAVPLQLAEHAPLPPDQLDWVMVDTKLAGERLSIRVAMARVEVLDAIEAGFREHTLPVPPILVETGSGQTVALRRDRGARIALSSPWALAIGIVALTPFLLLGILHGLVVEERNKVAHLADAARPRLAIERRVRQQAIVAHGLNKVLAAPSITSLVEDLADHLPPNTHALELSGRENGTIGITLSTTDADAVRANLLGQSRFLSLRQIDATQAQEGSSIVHYEARLR